MRCPHCYAAVLVEIGVTLANGQFTMHSCPSCENRWWDLNGEAVELARVLTTVKAA